MKVYSEQHAARLARKQQKGIGYFTLAVILLGVSLIAYEIVLLGQLAPYMRTG